MRVTRRAAHTPASGAPSSSLPLAHAWPMPLPAPHAAARLLLGELEGAAFTRASPSLAVHLAPPRMARLPNPLWLPASGV